MKFKNTNTRQGVNGALNSYLNAIEVHEDPLNGFGSLGAHDVFGHVCEGETACDLKVVLFLAHKCLVHL